uniref:Nuclear pore glycoprotein p62 n=1 Tax=Magallana gigas TaxID=29159 RepID=A0A8W8L8I8_MAGGI
MFGGNSGGSGFTFGTQTPSTQGAPASSSTSTPLGGGFSFGQKPAAPGTSAPPFSLGGQPQSSTPAQGGFSFGSSATPALATPGGFSFGQNPGSVPQATPSTQPNAPASTGTQLGGLAGFAMGKMPTASIGTPAAAPVGASAAPTGTTGLTLGATLGTAGAGFSLTGQPAAATKPVGISLGTTQATSTAGPTLGTLGTAASTTITGNPLGTASSGGGITFGTQKTTAAPTLGSLIGGATTAASTTQSTLGFPTPQPNINIQQHSALERENTYQLAENIDAQLKRMLSDLKEIIDHLNSSNTNQDQTDPIQQITKILNSHMDSLQWIDQNSTLLGRKVDEISKQMEVQKREQERNFRLVYN